MRKRTETLVRETAAKVGGLLTLKHACLYLMLLDEWQEAKAEPDYEYRNLKALVTAYQECAMDDRKGSAEALRDDLGDAYAWHTSDPTPPRNP